MLRDFWGGLDGIAMVLGVAAVIWLAEFSLFAVLTAPHFQIRWPEVLEQPQGERH